MTTRLAAIILLLSACKPDGDDKQPTDTDVGTDPDTDAPDTDTEPPTTECDQAEIPYDGIDNDCVGGDEKDVDGDGFNALVADGPDCDDEAEDVHPGAFDTLGDGADKDCDGVDGTDADGDGVASKGSGGLDCDDRDADAIWALVSVAPNGGEVAADTVFTATFAGDAAGAELSLTRDGKPLTASTTFSGALNEIVTLTPDAPLPAGGTYALRVQGPCGEDQTITVTTAPVPLDPALLVGRGWSIDVLNGTWLAPGGFGAVVGFLGTTEMLLTVPAVDLGRLAAGDMGKPPAQLMCYPTADVALAYPDDVSFELAFPALTLSIGSASVGLEDATLTATSTDGGLTLGPTEMIGALNVAGVDAILGGAGATCGLLAGLGVKCGPCPQSAGNTCLDFEVTDMPTAEVPGLVVDVRTEADIVADPACP